MALTLSEYMKQHYADHPERRPTGQHMYPYQSMAALAVNDPGMQDLLERAYEYYILKQAVK